MLREISIKFELKFERLLSVSIIFIILLVYSANIGILFYMKKYFGTWVGQFEGQVFSVVCLVELSRWETNRVM